MSKIENVEAHAIRDSRGRPTIEVVCRLEGGATGTASVPSGASTGAHEALELRDTDGGVNTAIAHVNGEIQTNVRGRAFDQHGLDLGLRALDGTEMKSRLGANAILAVSYAFARAAAVEQGQQLFEYIGNLWGTVEFRLPQPLFNIINGGKHADSGLSLQEFLIAPVAFSSIEEKVDAARKIIAALESILKERKQSTELGDEGGFAPKLFSTEEALELLVRASSQALYDGKQVKMALDAAANSFYQNGAYELRTASGMRSLTAADLIAWYEELVSAYPLISIEDGLAEEDWAGFSQMTQRLGGTILIVGDDLTVTTVSRMEKAKEGGAINAVIIKPNQIGTITETIDAVTYAKSNNWKTFASHRSGETNDTFIADLSVGLSCDFIKAGSLTREERLCKYTRLIEIENKLLNR